jgi:hypothetical protein
MDAMTAAICAIVIPAYAGLEPPTDSGPGKEVKPPAARPPGQPAPPVSPAPAGDHPAAEPAKADQPRKEADAAPPVAFPHPLITEILYAVPHGPEGDANLDATRDAAADEFVEIVNPHAKPIQLFGYTITDRNPEKKGQFKFTFPVFELPPGGVVVVFNGCEATWSGAGPIGDAQKAPAGPNGAFNNAHIFTARAASSRISFANAGDFVLLSDPSSQPIQCVSWGTFKEEIPEAALLETAPVATRASVQRGTLAGGFAVHKAAEQEPKVAFSPGRFECVSVAQEEKESPSKK